MTPAISTPLSAIKILQTCAYCPNPCRRAWPANLKAPLETELPSNAALLTLAMHSKRIVIDDALRHAVDVDAPGLCACVAACSYQLDVLGALRSVLSS